MAKVGLCLGILGSCFCPKVGNDVVVDVTTTTVLPVILPSQSTTTRPSQERDQKATVLACIRSYEGSNTSNTGNGYYGAYQFDLLTWRGVGGEGLPSDARS